MSLVTRTLSVLTLLSSLALAMSPARAAALGPDALIFIAPSALTVSYGDLEQQIRMAGARDVQVTGSWTAGTDLATSFRLVVVTPYDGPLDGAVATDLIAFANVGGGIVIMAEHDFGIDTGNQIATQLGIGARFTPMDTGGGCSSTPSSSTTHPLMNGVDGIDFAWSCTVSGGTLLAGTSAPIVTTEGTVVLAGDSDIFSDPVALGGCPHGIYNQRFFQNLFTTLPDPTHGMMMSGGDAGPSAPDGGVTMTDLGRSCVASTDCASGICLDDLGVRYCSMPCTSTCPSDYTCDDLGGQHVCVAPRIGGGCSTSHGRGNAATWIALAILCLIARRRRSGPRRRARQPR